MTFLSSAEKEAVSGAAEAMRFSVSRTMSNTSLSAGRSALGERFTGCVEVSLRLVILRRVPVLGDNDTFVQRLAEQGREVLVAGRPAFWIAGMAFFETGLAGRLAVTHLVAALLVNGIGGLRLAREVSNA